MNMYVPYQPGEFEHIWGEWRVDEGHMILDYLPLCIVTIIIMSKGAVRAPGAPLVVPLPMCYICEERDLGAGKDEIS